LRPRAGAAPLGLWRLEPERIFRDLSDEKPSGKARRLEATSFMARFGPATGIE